MQIKGKDMKFEWKMERGKALTFEDKIHNLSCFEIVLNILRMKATAGDEDVQEEIQALCWFALESMFQDKDLADTKVFDKIMKRKDKMVHKFRATIINQMGLPGEMVDANEIGEA